MGFEPMRTFLRPKDLKSPPLDQLGQSGEKNSFTSFRRRWCWSFTNISAFWRARSHCANQRAADKGFEPLTSRSQRVYYTNHHFRIQPDLNQRPRFVKTSSTIEL